MGDTDSFLLTHQGTALTALTVRRCQPLQIKFHPDKVPAAAPLAERVMAEEVSKILNAHNWHSGGR